MRGFALLLCVVLPGACGNPGTRGTLEGYRGAPALVGGLRHGASLMILANSLGRCDAIENLRGTVNGVPMNLVRNAGRSFRGPLFLPTEWGPSLNECNGPLLVLDAALVPHDDPLIFEITDGETTFHVTLENPWQPETVRLVSSTTTFFPGDRVEVELVPSENHFGSPPGDTQSAPLMTWQEQPYTGRYGDLEDVSVSGNRMAGTVPHGGPGGDGAFIAGGESHRVLTGCEGFGSCAWNVDNTGEGASRQVVGVTMHTQ